MLRLTKALRYTLLNPKVVHSARQFKEDPRIDYYPIVGLKHSKTGAILFNKPQNNNMLTQQCLDQFFRFFCSYQKDNSIESVWVQHRGRQFSGGVDYEQLVNNQHYFDKLFKTSILLGKFNKPIFSNINGNVRGIASYILTMFSGALGTSKATFRIDDTSRGFVPIFGGSHRLSQMPYQIGLYLALTGQKIGVEQMIKLNILKGQIVEDVSNLELRHKLSDANLFMQRPYHYSGMYPTENEMQNNIKDKMQKFKTSLANVQGQLMKYKRNFFTKFAVHQHRLAQMQFQNAKTPFHSLSQKQNLKINNYYELRKNKPMKYLHSKGLIQERQQSQLQFLKFPIHKILTIFSKDSLKEVLIGLKNDDSKWAQDTYNKIIQNDSLATHLTFNLIKKAKNKSWIECLEMEYQVAKKLLKISEFEICKWDKGEKKILKNPYSETPLLQISEKNVKQFFKMEKSEQLEHEIVKDSLVPVCDWWKQIPDSIRYYLNNQFFYDIHQSNTEKQVQRFLQLNKVDYRDRTFSLDILRGKVNEMVLKNKEIDEQKQRIKFTLKNHKLKEKLMRERKQFIDEVKNQTVKQKINRVIKKEINQKFHQRYEGLEETAQLGGREQKMNIFREYRQTLIKNIVLNGAQRQRQNFQRNDIYRGIVRFDEHGQNIFEADEKEKYQEIQELQQQIGKGKLSLSAQFKEKYEQAKKPKELGVNDDNMTEIITLKEKKDQIVLSQHSHLPLKLKQEVEKYKYLIKSASKTSQEVAGLLQWSDQDVEAMLVNSEKQEMPFLQYAEQIVERQNKNITNREQVLKSTNEKYKKWRQKLFDFQKNPGQTRSNTPFLFDHQVIPRPFRKAYLKLLDDIVMFFTEKYKRNGQFPIKQNAKSYLDNLVQNNMRIDYTQFIENDVHYVFSYLSILHLKNMIFSIQEKGGLENISNPIEFLKDKFAINFENYTIEQINSEFMKFLYCIMDKYSESKDKIIMPQTKIIDFITRAKIQFESKRNIDLQLSFESLMLLIAKDRKRIKNIAEGKDPFLGSQPDYALSLLRKEHEQVKSYVPKKQDPNQHSFGQYVNHIRERMEDNQKSLINNFVFYLMTIEDLVQKASGKDLFLPQEWRSHSFSQDKKLLEDILNPKITHEKWFDQTLENIVKILFDYREAKEKKMSSGGLLLFDKQFSQMLEPEVIKVFMEYKLKQQILIGQKLAEQMNAEKEWDEQKKRKQLFKKIKQSIKNKKALKMLNNLMFVEDIKSQDAYQNDMDQKYEFVPETSTRLVREMLDYPQEDNHQWDSSLYKRKILGAPTNLPVSPFLQQIKSIKNLMKEEDDLKHFLGKQLSLLKVQ